MRSAGEMQLRGYPQEDIVSCSIWLLRNNLVEADHMNSIELALEDSVKITAAGFIHLRLLSERLEYIYGVLATTPISESTVAEEIARFIDAENQSERVGVRRMVACVRGFLVFLKQQHALLVAAYPNFGTKECGSNYIIEQIEHALRFAEQPRTTGPIQPNLLDG